MKKSKRIIALILAFVIAVTAPATICQGSHAGGHIPDKGYQIGDSVTDEELFHNDATKVSGNLPTPADISIQSAKNKKGETINTLHWRNPMDIVPYESKDLQVEICCKFTIGFLNPKTGKQDTFTSNDVFIGRTPYTTSDTGFKTNLDASVEKYLEAVKDDEEFLNKFGWLVEYLKAPLSGSYVSGLVEALTLGLSGNYSDAIGVGTDTAVNTAFNTVNAAYNFNTNFEYKSVKYYLRYYLPKQESLCEKGEDGKYHASITYHNPVIDQGHGNSYTLYITEPGSFTEEHESDYPIICWVTYEEAPCTVEHRGMYCNDPGHGDEYGKFIDDYIQSRGDFAVGLATLNDNGDVITISLRTPSVSVPFGLPASFSTIPYFSYENCGFMSFGQHATPSNELMKKAFDDFIAGNPDESIFTGKSYRCSPWAACAAKYVPKSSSVDGNQNLEKEQTVTVYDKDGEETSIDVTGVESWLEKIYKKECEILRWLKLSILAGAMETLLTNIVNVVTSLEDTMSDFVDELKGDLVGTLTIALIDALLGGVAAAAESLYATSSTCLPFSIVGNSATVINALQADPVAPQIKLKLKVASLGKTFSQEIDFSVFETVHDVYIAFLMIFVCYSMYGFTRKIIGYIDEVLGRSNK